MTMNQMLCSGLAVTLAQKKVQWFFIPYKIIFILHHVSELKLSLRTIILTMIFLLLAIVLAKVIPMLFQPQRDSDEGLWSPSMSFNQDAHIWFIYTTTE